MHSEDTFADKYNLDEKVSISHYPLSASVACSKFCCALVSSAVRRPLQRATCL